MSAIGKIALGALATTAAAWFLHGPLGLGEKCSDGANSSAGVAPVNEAPAEPATVAAAETPATVEAVTECQGKVDQVARAGTINFVTGGAAISSDSAALLDNLATAAKACAGTAIEVAGHTDAQGSAQSNQALSQRRAAAVVAALEERGVPAARLSAHGYGETQPKDASGPENNPINRRIEFHVAALQAAPAN